MIENIHDFRRARVLGSAQVFACFESNPFSKPYGLDTYFMKLERFIENQSGAAVIRVQRTLPVWWKLIERRLLLEEAESSGFKEWFGFEYCLHRMSDYPEGALYDQALFEGVAAAKALINLKRTHQDESLEQRLRSVENFVYRNRVRVSDLMSARGRENLEEFLASVHSRRVDGVLSKMESSARIL